MTFSIDANGFLTSAQNAIASVEIEPAPHLQIPHWVNGAWQEGLIRRAHLLDEFGFYIGTDLELDPRVTQNFATATIPDHLILPRWHDSRWIEGTLNFVALIGNDGFLISILQNVDPRTTTANHINTFPPQDFVLPRYVDGEWIDIAVKRAVVIDAEGYILGFAENIDPRNYPHFFTPVFPEGDFLVPRFVDHEWIEAGIRHAWQLDDEGYFVADLHNFDPRTIDHSYTTVPLESGVFRKPQFVNGAWIEANPVLPVELIANAKQSKRLEIETALATQLTAGVPFKFGEQTDIVQTRFERDLINISGVTTRAILLKSQGEEAAVIQFRAESNTTYLLTPDEAIALGQAVAVYTEEIYNKGWNLKDQLAQADDLNDITTIIW